MEGKAIYDNRQLKAGRGSKAGGKTNLGRDVFDVFLGYIDNSMIQDKIKEIEVADKIGARINHLTDDNIYAILSTVGHKNGIPKKTFKLFVGGEEQEGSITEDSLRKNFKLDGVSTTNFG